MGPKRVSTLTFGLISLALLVGYGILLAIAGLGMLWDALWRKAWLGWVRWQFWAL